MKGTYFLGRPRNFYFSSGDALLGAFGYFECDGTVARRIGTVHTSQNMDETSGEPGMVFGVQLLETLCSGTVLE